MIMIDYDYGFFEEGESNPISKDSINLFLPRIKLRRYIVSNCYWRVFATLLKCS